MNFPRGSAENKNENIDKIAPESPSPCLLNVPQHLVGENHISVAPAAHNFPQSMTFLWQVLNDMGLVKTSKALRVELSETGFGSDPLSCPFIPTSENSDPIGFASHSTTATASKGVNNRGNGMTRRPQSTPFPQYPPLSVSVTDETEGNCDDNLCEHRHPATSNSASNSSFHSLLEKVLREKLGEDERKVMSIIQVLSYYTVEPLTGALSSLEHARRRSPATSDDVMSSVGQVNRVINALSDLYDSLTAVAFANNGVNGSACDACERSAFSASSLPSFLKRVFLQYCTILLLQQNLAENLMFSDIISQWPTSRAQCHPRKSKPQPHHNPVAQEGLTLDRDDDNDDKNDNEDGTTKGAEREDPRKASPSVHSSTASSGKPKSRKKRRASVSVFPTPPSLEGVESGRTSVAAPHASTSATSRPTKAPRRSHPSGGGCSPIPFPSSSMVSASPFSLFFPASSLGVSFSALTSSAAKAGVRRNVLQCGGALLSEAHSLHLTLAPPPPLPLLRNRENRENRERPSSNGGSKMVSNASSKVSLAEEARGGGGSAVVAAAAAVLSAALAGMRGMEGRWRHRAEAVLRRVLRHASLGDDHAKDEETPQNGKGEPQRGEGEEETGKESTVGDPESSTLGEHGEWGLTSSIRAVEDACYAPGFREAGEQGADGSVEQPEMYVGMEAFFLPRCPSCDREQGDVATDRGNDEDVTEEEGLRADQEKIAFIRIWHTADRAQNILWMLQSAEEYVRLTQLSTTGTSHRSGRREKALEEAISVWEGQWAAQCASVLEQTLLAQAGHGVAGANNKGDSQDKEEKLKTNSCLAPSAHLEYRRHRYERLFTNPSLSSCCIEEEEVAAQDVPGRLPGTEHVVGEDQTHSNGAAASEGMPYVVPPGAPRGRDITNRNMSGKTLWDVFLGSVYALADEFCLTAAQLLLEVPSGMDAAPPQRVGEGDCVQGEDASTLTATVAGLGGANDDNLLVRMRQENRFRVCARFLSSFALSLKCGQLGPLQPELHDSSELCTHRCFPTHRERQTLSSPLVVAKSDVSVVFPYIIGLSGVREATPQQSNGSEWKEGSKQGQPYRDNCPNNWTAEHKEAMGPALSAIMCSLQSGSLMSGVFQQRHVRPLRHRLRRVLEHQHVLLNAQCAEMPLALQIRALQNPAVLEAVQGASSESAPGPETIYEAPQNVSTDRNTTNDATGEPENPNEGDSSVSGEAALIPTPTATVSRRANAYVLSAQAQPLIPVHFSGVPRGRAEEEHADRGAMRRRGVFHGGRFALPTLASIRRVAQDISMTVERAILTSDVASWRIEGGAASPVSLPAPSPSATWNATGEEREEGSPPPLQQALPHRSSGGVTNNVSAAEEEESTASDASSSDNHFNRAADETAEEVQQVTVTPCGNLVAFVTTRGRLVVYALRASAEEVAYREELLVDTVLPGTPRHPHWYEAHSAIVQFSPDGRFVMATVQFMLRGVAEGEEEEESRTIPGSTGRICIYSLHRGRSSATTSSTSSGQQDFPSAQRRPFKRLFQMPSRFYAEWKIHDAPITATCWIDPRFWGGGWTGPRDAFLDLKLKDHSAKDSTDQQHSALGSQNRARDAVDAPQTSDALLWSSSAAWNIAARARLAVFQCFSTGLDDLIVRWLPCSGVVIQRIATAPVQDLVVSPLMAALYTIDDSGSLSMYDAWNEAEGYEGKDPGHSPSTMPIGVAARPTIMIGTRGLPSSAGLLPAPEESADFSSRRQVRLGADQEMPEDFFYGTRIVRFDRSGIIARHQTSFIYLTDGNSSSSVSLPVTGRNGNHHNDTEAGAMGYLARFLNLATANQGKNVGTSNSADGSLLSQGMSFQRSARMGRKLIQSVLAEQMLSPTPNSVMLSPSSISTSQSNSTSESDEKAEEYCHAGMQTRSGLGCRYPLSAENETSAGDGSFPHRSLHKALAYRYRDASGIPNAFYKSGSRLVFSEVERALCLAGNVLPAQHGLHIENAGLPYHLLSLALSGKPHWGSIQHDTSSCDEGEEAIYSALIRLWWSRRPHDSNSHQITRGRPHNSHKRYVTNDRSGDSGDTTDIKEVLSISYFVDCRSRGSPAHNSTLYGSTNRSYDHNNERIRGESERRLNRSCAFAAHTVYPSEMQLAPTARNGRYLALMASIGPSRILADRIKPLEYRPGLYGCLIFDTYMSYVVRVVAVCPVQPITSLAQNGTIPSRSDAKKTPIFSLQCALTVIDEKPVGSHESDAPATHARSCNRETDLAASVAYQKSQISASRDIEGGDEKVILTVGGLHNTLYIFDALSGDRIRTVILREADFAQKIQAQKTRVMGDGAMRDSCETELQEGSPVSLPQPANRVSASNTNRGGILPAKQEKTGGFPPTRGVKSKVSVEDILHSLSTWDRLEGVDQAARSASNKVDHGARRGQFMENATTRTDPEGADKIWFQMADLSEEDHTWSTSEDEAEVEGNDLNEEVSREKGWVERHSHRVQHRRRRNRRWLIDQLVQRYGLPLVLYAQQRLASVIYWPAEMREPFLNDGCHDIAAHNRVLLEEVSQGEVRSPYSKAPWQNPVLQTLSPSVGGEAEGRMLLTTMADLSHRLRIEKFSQHRNSLPGVRDHPDKHCGDLFYPATACFDEPFKLAVEQLTELSHVMSTITRSDRVRGSKAASSPITRMMSGIYRGNTPLEESETQNENTNTSGSQGNRQQHQNDHNLHTNSSVRYHERGFEEGIMNVPGVNRNDKLLHCGVVNTVAAWWSVEHFGTAPQRSAFHVLAGTESGQLHIVGGFL